jgi:hypothetical protein
VLEAAAASMEAARIAADNTLIAAKVKTDGARVRGELDRRRFEIEAILSESLAQIEDENANDLVSSHGLDAARVSDWVGKTHSQVITDNVSVVPVIVDRVLSTQVSIPEVASGVVPNVPILAPIPYPSLTVLFHLLLDLMLYLLVRWYLPPNLILIWLFLLLLLNYVSTTQILFH